MRALARMRVCGWWYVCVLFSEMASIAKGRPKSSVDKEQLKCLRSLRFTWEEAAALLGTSSKTFQRRAKEWNITSYSEISDADLDRAVSNILEQFPSSGETMISGNLKSQKVGPSGVLYLCTSFCVCRGRG